MNEQHFGVGIVARHISSISLIRSHLVFFIVESLMITPFLPVVAFGQPLPKLTPQ